MDTPDHLARLRSSVTDAGLGRDVPGMTEPAALTEVQVTALASVAESLASIADSLRDLKLASEEAVANR